MQGATSTTRMKGQSENIHRGRRRITEPPSRRDAHTIDVGDANDLRNRWQKLEDKPKHWQESMKLDVFFELGSSTWEDADLCAKLYSLHADSISEVLAIPAVTQAFVELDSTKGSGYTFHAPLCHLYNELAAVIATKIRLPEPQSLRRACITSHSFLRADFALIDGHRFQPDLVVRTVSSSPRGRRFWYNADIGMELGREWSNVMEQAGIYAQQLFLAHPSRSFVLVICLNTSTYELRFLFFHRGGVHSTPAMSVKTGREQIVEVMVCAAALQAGLRSWDLDWDATAPAPSSVRYHPEVLEMLHTRTALTGRATRVSVVRLLKHPPASSPGAVNSPKTRSSARRMVASTPSVPKGAKPELSTDSAPILPPVVGNLGTSISAESYEQALISYLVRAPLQIVRSLDPEPPPGALVVKDVWGIIDRPSEASLFDTPAFGLPMLWAWQSLDRLSTVFDGTAQSWPVFGAQYEEANASDNYFEDRSHLVMYFKTHGGALDTHARTPRALLEAVFHAMIGHYVLYSEKEVLHRDVSAGNILILPTPEERPAVSLNVIEDLTMCSGILIDGDLARSIHETDSRRSPSGTLPFMSRGVLKAAVRNTQHTHSVADDLESSIWVIIWEYLGHAAGHQKLTPDMKSWFDGLSSSDPTIVLGVKNDMMVEYMEESTVLGCAPLDTIVKRALAAFRGEPPQQCYVSFFKIFDEVLGSKSTDLSSVLDASWTQFFASFP